MKFQMLKQTWLYAWKSLGLRYRRFFKHLLVLFGNKPLVPRSEWWEWPVDFIFYLSDLILIDMFLSSFAIVLFSKSRFLDDEEIALTQEVYKESIDHNMVIINVGMPKFIQKFAYALVTFNIVHWEEEIEDYIFVHEMMHIYQYQRFGSIYLYKALRAQANKYNYDYGGVPRLMRGVMKGKTIFDYNFEQQAMIIEHFYRRNSDFNFYMKNAFDDGVYDKYYQDLFS